MDEREVKREEERPERHLRLVPPPEPTPEPNRRPRRLWLLVGILAVVLSTVVLVSSLIPPTVTLDGSVGPDGESARIDSLAGDPENWNEEPAEGATLFVDPH